MPMDLQAGEGQACRAKRVGQGRQARMDRERARGDRRGGGGEEFRTASKERGQEYGVSSIAERGGEGKRQTAMPALL
jgi:hypothetical protein